MNKVLATVDEGGRARSRRASIMMGGFGRCGIPENLIAALRSRETKNLTVY